MPESLRPAPGAIAYTCTCGSRIQMPAANAGRRARCRKCGAVFTLPTAPPPRFVPPPVIIEIEPETDDPGPAIWGTTDDFWHDLGRSFVFFVADHNYLTLIGVGLVHLLLLGFSSLTAMSSRSGYFLFGEGLIAGWLCTFYLSIILETANGEDRLPNPGTSDLTDLIDSLIDFIGATAAAMLPWIVLRLLQAFSKWSIPDEAIRAAGMAGAFCWPAIVLTTAIGRGWEGLWPHIVLRVPLAGPIAYAAIGTMTTAFVAVAGPGDLLQLRKFLPALSGINSLAMAVGKSILTAYAGIVLMRAIGLYYRHYKSRLPFEAE